MRALVLEHWRSDAFVVYGEVLAEREIAVDRILASEIDRLPEWRDYDLILALGGPASVYDEDAHPWLVGEKRLIREAVDSGMPYFGVCFGAQLLASALGAEVYLGPAPELGLSHVFLTEAARRDPVFRGFPRDLEVFEWHRDAFELPPGAERLARSPRYANQAMRVGRVAYGVQCHFEKSAEDITRALEATPAFLDELEARQGRRALSAFLESYAVLVPFLQQTAKQLLRRWLEVSGAAGRPVAATRSRSLREDNLLGRSTELERIERLLDRARAGASDAMIIRGDAGLGKSTLLATAGERAQDVRVLRATGVESDTELAFSGLRELCAPLVDDVEMLPDEQATLVMSALELRGRTRAADRFGVYAAFNDLLGAAAEAAPLLVLVDDAHWLDEATIEALSFAIRSGGRPGVAFLLATDGETLTGIGAEELRLQGLDPSSMRSLLEARTQGVFVPGVIERLLQVAAGNPLTLLELASTLAAGAEDAERLLHSRATAEEAFVRRIDRLPSGSRSVLLLAALEPQADMQTLTRAGRELGVDAALLVAAEGTGLVARGATGVVFRHPLVRSAVVYHAQLAERRAAHHALAETLDSAVDPDRRAWHLGRGATGPDQRAALALCEAAARAQAARAHGTAARGFELAARLTAEPELQGRRLLSAAEAAYLAGHLSAALDHLEAARRRVEDAELLSELDHRRGRILARMGSAARAQAVLEAAADRGQVDNPGKAALMLADAVIPCLRSGRPRDACVLGRRAFALAERAESLTRVKAGLMLGTALIFTGEFEQGRRLVCEAADLPLPPGALDFESRAYLGRSLRLAGHNERARAVFAELIRDARAEGALGTMPYALARSADVELECGRWTSARELLRRAVVLAQETGQGSDEGLALGTLAWLDAAQGREDDCRAHVMAAAELAESLGTGSQLDRAGLALGLFELGRGRPDSAIPPLEETLRQQRAQGWSDAAVRPHVSTELIEAYVLVGRESDAAELFATFAAETGQASRLYSAAVAARCQALFGSPEAADLFERSLAYAGGDLSPFELARTQLLYAKHLRHHERPELAGGHGAAALATFEALEASPWADQARDVLGQVGAPAEVAVSMPRSGG